MLVLKVGRQQIHPQFVKMSVPVNCLNSFWHFFDQTKMSTIQRCEIISGSKFSCKYTHGYGIVSTFSRPTDTSVGNLTRIGWNLHKRKTCVLSFEFLGKRRSPFLRHRGNSNRLYAYATVGHKTKP